MREAARPEAHVLGVGRVSPGVAVLHLLLRCFRRRRRRGERVSLGGRAGATVDADAAGVGGRRVAGTLPGILLL